MKILINRKKILYHTKTRFHVISGVVHIITSLDIVPFVRCSALPKSPKQKRLAISFDTNGVTVAKLCVRALLRIRIFLWSFRVCVSFSCDLPAAMGKQRKNPNMK